MDWVDASLSKFKTQIKQDNGKNRAECGEKTLERHLDLSFLGFVETMPVARDQTDSVNFVGVVQISK